MPSSPAPSRPRLLPVINLLKVKEVQRAFTLGYSWNSNLGIIEGPTYAAWDTIIFNGYTMKLAKGKGAIIRAAQHPISVTQIDDSGDVDNAAITRRSPDLTYYYFKAKYLNPVNHTNLFAPNLKGLSMLITRGWLSHTKSALNITEVKRGAILSRVLTRLLKAKNWDACFDELERGINVGMGAARDQIAVQVQYFFEEYEERESVVTIATSGDRWSWKEFHRDNVESISDTVDRTYSPSAPKSPLKAKRKRQSTDSQASTRSHHRKSHPIRRAKRIVKRPRITSPNSDDPLGNAPPDSDNVPQLRVVPPLRSDLAERFYKAGCGAPHDGWSRVTAIMTPEGQEELNAVLDASFYSQTQEIQNALLGISEENGESEDEDCEYRDGEDDGGDSGSEAYYTENDSEDLDEDSGSDEEY